MNPDALSIEPLHSFKWTPVHFEMSLGPYFQNEKKNERKKKIVQAINLEISSVV